jgi:hypothetical protein
MSLHLQLDVTFGPLDQEGHRTVELHSLRIQLPEELEGVIQGAGVKKEKKALRQAVEAVKAVEAVEAVEEKQPLEHAPTEYEAASPRFTWTDEQVRSAKQERFGELLWPVVLRSYGLTGSDLSPVFSTYKAFLGSRMYRMPHLYPHHSLCGLMEWYIEEHFHLMKNKMWTEEEREQLRRRHMLRRMFLNHNLTWSVEYVEVYLEWSKGCRVGMNRYQKMRAFLEMFFE